MITKRNMTQEEIITDMKISHQALINKFEIKNNEIKDICKQANTLLNATTWYPECHNDLDKLACDHCMNCWDIQCNQSMCDRIGRCLCEGTACHCLGR